MDVEARISQEILDETGHRPEEFQLIREKNGVYVYRCIYEGRSAVAKYFAPANDREKHALYPREIANYRGLQRAGVPTIRVYAICKRCILLEDIEASDEWRMGAEEDMSDPEVLCALAKWYYALHETNRRDPMFYGLTSENDDLNEDTLELLRQHMPEAGGLLDYIGGHLDEIRCMIRLRENMRVYNDFYYTNFIVKKDKTEALMFDYDCMGRGYRYADFRNVQSSVSEEAFEAFVKEYEALYLAENGRSFELDRKEIEMDRLISPLLGLANAFKRETLPAWAEELKEEAISEGMLERAKEIVKDRQKLKLIQHMESYIPYCEQEEQDLETICCVLYGAGKESDSVRHMVDDCSDSLLTRENRTMHMTASAWVVSPDRKYVLMAYHNIYKSWAWLGGHADGEADLMEVARREVMEESGVRNVRPIIDTIFSVEILTVDGHVKKGKYVPSHLHLNVTYLFEADMDEKLAVKADENSAVQWIPVGEVAKKVSEPWMMERVYSKLMEKTARLGSMKRVILSADNLPTVYAVPDAVAEDLGKYCVGFCNDWLVNSPDTEKYRVYFDKEDGPDFGLCYNEKDFIEYLNRFVFPDEPSFAVRHLEWREQGTEEYGGIPRFNF